MPERWDRYVDDFGSQVRAIQREKRFAVSDEDGRTVEGEPGDYLVKGGDGRRRVVPATAFEGRFHLIAEG